VWLTFHGDREGAGLVLSFSKYQNVCMTNSWFSLSAWAIILWRPALQMVLSTNAFLFLSDQARKAMHMHPDRQLQVFDIYPSETKSTDCVWNSEHKSQRANRVSTMQVLISLAASPSPPGRSRGHTCTHDWPGGEGLAGSDMKCYPIATYITVGTETNFGWGAWCNHQAWNWRFSGSPMKLELFSHQTCLWGSPIYVYD